MNEKAIVIFGLLGLGILWLATRNRAPQLTSSGSIPLQLRPSGSAHHYTNEETWEIDWNEDGLPKKVTIHRNAIQS